MKAFKLLVIICLFSAWGCIQDPDYDCTPVTRENMTIHFSLKNDANTEMLLTVVDNVTLFLYDANGKQALRKTVSKGEMNQFLGVRLELSPATYTIVAWANHTNTYSRFLTNDDNSYLDQVNNYLLNAVTANGVVDNGDPLYYAPKTKGVPLTVTVPAEGKVEVTAQFRHAHIKIDVTVEGYDHISTRAVDPLTVELTNITSRYSFGMGAHGDRVSYIRPAPQTNAQDKIFNTLFNVPVFDKNTTTHVRVTDSAGELIIDPISIKELLGDKVNPEEIQYLPIRIVFSEKNGLLEATVVVDLPEWSENPVKPNV